ncbi:MAG: carbohydrate porin [Rhodoferax sp.]
MIHTVNISVRTAVATAVLSLSGAAFAAAFDANIELDNTYRSGNAVAEADKGLGQGGRVEMNATGKAGANMFVAGKAAFLAKKDGTVATDDMWIQVGSAGGDVKLGRFEAADLFPLAQDTLINHAGNVYGTNTLRGRKDGSQFHAAGTLNLSAGLSLEFGVVENKTTAKGVRPVLSYLAGPLTARLGFEAGKYAAVGGASANDMRGVGATVGYDFGGFKLTGNIASGKTDAATRNTQTALGLTVAAGGLVVGLIAAKTEAPIGESKVQTAYASYSMPLFDIKGATWTPALSSSTAKNSAMGTDVKENSFRIRLNYAF